LRLVHAAKDPAAPTPRVLGVDDWARRRGQTYGTILVDLERHRPIDLLEDRTAESFEAWLRQHPGVEVIARDRGGAYADGARKGAPKAVQVADRFHLLVNIGDALERLLARKHACLKEAAAAVSRLAAGAHASVEPEPTPVAPMPTVTRRQTRVEQDKQARRARRLARYESIVELHQQGKSLRAIAEELRISRATVRRFIRADGFPERAAYPLRPTSLTPYEPYLRERWAAGCQNARALWEEIQALGFRGALVTVRRCVGGWRVSPGRRGPTPRQGRPVDGKATPPPPKPTRVLSPRQARWLLLRPVDDLRPEERTYRHELLQEDEIQRGQNLTEAFGRLVRERDRAALMPWLSRAEESGLSEYREFAIVLRRDLAAVEAALTHEWSNGQAEGQINRLKMLKRQMFGRASLSLLRRRFLRAA
jgi:transposase